MGYLDALQKAEQNARGGLLSNNPLILKMKWVIEKGHWAMRTG